MLTAKRDVWPRIQEAVADLCADLDGPLLEQLAAIEDGLAAAPALPPRRQGDAMSHILDRPVWNALNTRHAALAQGGSLAKRYAPDIHPFASSRDESPESLACLAEIAAPGETLIFLQADEFVAPPDFTVDDDVVRRSDDRRPAYARDRGRAGESSADSAKQTQPTCWNSPC